MCEEVDEGKISFIHVLSNTKGVKAPAICYGVQLFKSSDSTKEQLRQNPLPSSISSHPYRKKRSRESKTSSNLSQFSISRSCPIPSSPRRTTQATVWVYWTTQPPVGVYFWTTHPPVGVYFWTTQPPVGEYAFWMVQPPVGVYFAILIGLGLVCLFVRMCL